MTAQVLGAAVHDDVDAKLERAQQMGVRKVLSHTVMAPTLRAASTTTRGSTTLRVGLVRVSKSTTLVAGRMLANSA